MSTLPAPGSADVRRKRLLDAAGFVGNAVDRLEVPGRSPAPEGSLPAGPLRDRLVLVRTVDTRGLAGIGAANVVVAGATVAVVLPLSAHATYPGASADEAAWLAELAANRASPATEQGRWLIVTTVADLPAGVQVSLVDGGSPRAGFEAELATLGPGLGTTRRVDLQRLAGVDHVVVVDTRVEVSERLRQRVLLVRFLHAGGVASLRADAIRIDGGERVPEVEVRWAWPLWGLADVPDPELTAPERAALVALDDGMIAGEAERWLAVLTEEPGDFSPYLLRIVAGDGLDKTRPGFDTVLSRARVRFKVDCPAPFDCRPPAPPEAPEAASPLPDYLARDFHAFRRLMLDRLAVLRSGDALDANPASVRSTLVDLVAYAADELSYMQDAVATEAYLTTARRRTSVRRHARALDYRMHEGCAARAWVQLQAAPGTLIEAGTLEVVRPGDRFATAVGGLGAVVAESRRAEVEQAGAVLFQAVTGLDRLVDAHNEIALHSWGEPDATMAAGAVEAVLVDSALRLRIAVGDVLVFEAIAGGPDHVAVDADPALRHAVRVTEVVPGERDLLLNLDLLIVRWAGVDALPFDLPVVADGTPLAVARAGVVLVDHGGDQVEQGLRVTPWGRNASARLRLGRKGLVWAAPLTRARPGMTGASAVDLGGDDPNWAAVDGLQPEPRAAVPAIRLVQDEVADDWEPLPDLLDAPADAAVFVAEREHDGTVTLRFGDGVHGRRPPEGAVFRAEYRVATQPGAIGGASAGGTSGSNGNVGAGAIAHLISNRPGAAAVARVVQPLAGGGGVEPENVEAVRILAPRSYRTQLRAVTLADWAEIAGRHPEIQRAVATLHWMGSWHLVRLHVDRTAGLPVDAAFEAELEAWLEPYRLTGYEVEVVGPTWASLDIALTVTCLPGVYRAHVEADLMRWFGTAPLAEGGLGWFHPDRFTFGDEVYLSPIVARIMQHPGVARVDTSPAVTRHRFRRTTESSDHLDTGRLEIGALEIARCESNPNAPERGRIRLYMEGGA